MRNHWNKKSKSKYLISFFLTLIFLGNCTIIFAKDYNYFSPTDFEFYKKRNEIFVLGKTANIVQSYSFPHFEFIKNYKTKLPPKSIAIADNKILIACSYSEGELLVLNNKLNLLNRIDVGHGACDVVTNSDFSLAFVANEYSNDVSIVDLKMAKEINRIKVLRQPSKLAISTDNNYLFVANFLPDGPANLDTVNAKVSVIDIAQQKVLKHIPLSNGSNALRGISMSSDGEYVFISHNLGRFQVPTSQLEQGWMNTSAISVIKANELTFVATILLDEPEYGAAGSWGIDCNSENIVVAHSGTHDFSLINYQQFVAKLNETKEKDKLSYDLRFLSGIRKRINAVGNGPREIKIFGSEVFVANYFSDTINVFDLKNPEKPLKHLVLNNHLELDNVRLGEIYFNDATYCFQGWQSCNGCHPGDGRTDGLNWDLLNDGIGNPKNCKSMLLAHKTPPSMITGIRPNAETAVRAGFRHIQFTQISEKHAAAVDEYLKSLQAIPSPYLINGEWSEKAIKGKEIFERVGCGNCHSGAYFSDLKKHEIGIPAPYDKQNMWDTPTLIETWRTGPYLHDGRSATMLDVFKTEKHGLKHDLTTEELECLVNYILSL